MPFTFAHPAAVLPLRRRLWLPGLVAGSVVPDLAYYLPVPGGAELTHSVLGVVGVDLLLGLALLALARPALAPLLALCPAGWRDRVAPPRGRTRWPVALASLAVGAATHVVWDTFTHTDGVAVRQWSLLRESVVGPHRVYNVIGYASSLGGLLLLGFVVARWYRRSTRDHGTRWPVLPRTTRALVLGGIGLAVVVGAVIGFADPVSRISAYDCVRNVLVGGVQGAGLAVALYVLGWHLSPTTP
ncbi:DUF4184 family protein [Saccharothrix sp. NPDC042600]|uniref:DUF4184 family protein n=1 Tax=Saccharothrix TaxID=2071 RepID=UPI0034094F11|nr:DUF4184 family protein [Saccharothrix mutabilis subsp. capreolus]